MHEGGGGRGKDSRAGQPVMRPTSLSLALATSLWESVFVHAWCGGQALCSAPLLAAELHAVPGVTGGCA